MNSRSEFAANPSEQPSAFLDVLFSLAIASLFSGLHYVIGPIKLQLSDLLAVVVIFVVVARGFAAPLYSRVLTIFLAAYLVVYLLSALSVSAENGAKEAIQAALLIGFLIVAFGHYRTRSTYRLFVSTSALLLMIMTANIAWHIAHGRLSGWKELNEPKTVFILLPLLLIMAVIRNRSRAGTYLITIAAILAATLIFISGERKAYIFSVAAFFIWNGAATLRYVIPASIVAMPLLLAGVSLQQNSYLSRQIGSLIDGSRSSEVQGEALTTLLDEHRPMTLSTAQREYALRRARALWEEKPLLGIGTNAFAPIIAGDVTLPREFRLGIHGEFYRALYENGLVGLFLYVLLFVAAFLHVALTWRVTAAMGDSTLSRLKLAILTMFTIYCSVEASKGITFLCIASMIFIVALRPTTLPVQKDGLGDLVEDPQPTRRKIGLPVE